MTKYLVLILAGLVLSGCGSTTANSYQPLEVTGPSGNGYQPGLQCDVYKITQVSDENATVNWPVLFSDSTFEFSFVASNLNVPEVNGSDAVPSLFTAAQQALVGGTNFAMDCYGYLNVPESTYYGFALGSDDGAQLILDNNVLINASNLHTYQVNSVVPFNLTAGLHKINVVYFQGPGSSGLDLMWQGQANQGLGTLAPIDASYFQH